ncbi:hypothetical protein [uncultured Phocaeicola sp.]|uniref:hypothetical protein n=1 Tax=uncultured Phocaeicola sp. TaxID=990718 RepID=UPI0025955524|nr:hypothetical protein [uncultured Phocaeicola sp.]
MKRYDLREIMKNAWRTYKYVAKRQGKTFAQVLKSTWRLAKMRVSVSKFMEEKPKSTIVQPISTPKPYEWSEGITAADIYPDNSRGYLGSKYCGD